MYIRVSSTPKSPRKSVKIVKSVREGYKVKQIMLHHVGTASSEIELEKLKQIGREFIAREQAELEAKSGQESLFEPVSEEERIKQAKFLENIRAKKKAGRIPKITLRDVLVTEQISLADLKEEQRIIEGIHEVAGHVYKKIGFDQILERKSDKDLALDLVLMRLAKPSSKRQTCQLLYKRFNKLYSDDRAYRLMDKIYPKIDEIKKAVFNKTKSIVPQNIDILFFDCTTLYFESTNTDEMRKFGYSKDHRFNTTQVVLALATNSDGLPIGYELFEGNKAEVKTLCASLESWKDAFNIGSVCFVADRALMSEDNLKMLEDSGYSYVIAAKLRSMPKVLREEILSAKNYTIKSFGDDYGWVGEFSYKSRRLVVSYKTNRANRDEKQRVKILDKIKKKLSSTENTKELISNNGIKKYTESQNSKTSLSDKKIEQDSMWDGLHGVISNIKDQSAVSLLQRYGRLWKIEESFRINKHTLSMRPIYHFKPERIKSHIAICYMAFSVLRHLEYEILLRQKISPEVLLDELMHVQASIYCHLPTGKRYRQPGAFSNIAAKIYKALRITRSNHAQEIIQN